MPAKAKNKYMDREEKTAKINKLRKQISLCQRCRLAKTRTHTVPGEGDVDAKLLFIGEAPGKNEDLQGKPFVGRAGSIFDDLLDSIGLKREQIYLCNILKCRPPDNRNPLPDEIQACVGSLDLQIKIVNPRVIVTLGNFATTYIFEKYSLPFTTISAVAGKVFDVGNDSELKKVVALFHPAVATYSPSKYETLSKHFQALKQFLGSRPLSSASQSL